MYNNCFYILINLDFYKPDIKFFFLKLKNIKNLKEKEKEKGIFKQFKNTKIKFNNFTIFFLNIFLKLVLNNIITIILIMIFN